MTTALTIVAVAFFLFVALAGLAVREADHAGDDFGAVIPAIVCGGLALFCLALELVLFIAHLFTH